MDQEGLLFPKTQEKKKRKKHPPSIIPGDNPKICYVCGCRNNIEVHHIFFGPALRTISEDKGLKVHNLKKGKTTRATIISNIEDPEAFGAERVRLDDVVFTEIKLADWEAEKLLEESIPFNFSGWEVLESIDV